MYLFHFSDPKQLMELLSQALSMDSLSDLLRQEHMDSSNQLESLREKLKSERVCCKILMIGIITDTTVYNTLMHCLENSMYHSHTCTVHVLYAQIIVLNLASLAITSFTCTSLFAKNSTHKATINSFFVWEWVKSDKMNSTFYIHCTYIHVCTCM